MKTIEEFLVKNNLNNYLYRFRKNNEYLMDIIENKQLFFSDVDGFTDPRDGRLIMNPLSVTPLHLAATFQKSYNKVHPYFVRNTIKNVAFDVRKQIMWAENSNKAIKENFIWSFCCFTVDWNNEIMWQNYDDHKGVALKFDILKDRKLFAMPMRMKYSNKKPEVNYSTERSFLTCILTKNEKYKDEDEVRIVKMQPKGKFKFNQKSLVQVIFGAKMGWGEINRLKELFIKNGFEHVEFKKVTFPEFNYDLELFSV